MITRNDEGLFFTYRLDNQLHRPNGPAKIDWCANWSWWLYGKRHRYYGPALSWAGKNWYIKGDWVKYEG